MIPTTGWYQWRLIKHSAHLFPEGENVSLCGLRGKRRAAIYTDKRCPQCEVLVTPDISVNSMAGHLGQKWCASLYQMPEERIKQRVERWKRLCGRKCQCGHSASAHDSREVCSGVCWCREWRGLQLIRETPLEGFDACRG